MKIEFKSIVPYPLKDNEQTEYSIWGNDYKWKSPQKT